MEPCTRRQRIEDLYHDLKATRNALAMLDSHNDESNRRKRMEELRAGMACIEHQIALLRLAQAEDRLTQYFWRAVFGFFGAAAAFLVTMLSR